MTDTHTAATDQGIETDIPARLDRLRWTRFHTLVIVALGITWILDGVQVTLAGALAGALKASPSLHMSDQQFGLSATVYVIGAVIGALFFGWLTDKLGRKRLFTVTLATYLVGTALSAFSFHVWTYYLFRFITGIGIGGEYTAINSAIQELVPARFRGRTDIGVNGSYWFGAALAALSTLVLLNPHWFAPDVGWRLSFGLGAVLGLAILFLRRFIPESPRWLMTHGHAEEAERVMRQIEERAGVEQAPSGLPRIRIRQRTTHLFDVARTLFKLYPRRSLLGLVLMLAQAFFYNSIFFSYALVLDRFFSVPSDKVGLYILPFAVGNLLGPLLLGHLFDTLGRRIMITFTYAISGVLLLITAWLFVNGWLTAVTQTIAWSVAFFFASAAASSAYLTVSESFPLEVRALAIAVFFALGTGVGALGPWLFGILVGTGHRSAVAEGYLLGAGLMIIAAGFAWKLGINAERRSLEHIAAPLSSDG